MQSGRSHCDDSTGIHDVFTEMLYLCWHFLFR